jgi:aminopeptidase N
MWWAGLVANDQALQPWLDEALCTLSEKIFYERYYPEAVDWWWEFRVSLYEPEGWVDSTIYDHDSFRPYVNAVYLQGVSFLQEARELLGEEAFLGALKAYLQGNSYGDGTTEELLALLDQRAPGQLDALIDEYFRSGGP